MLLLAGPEAATSVTELRKWRAGMVGDKQLGVLFQVVRADPPGNNTA